MNLNSLKYKIAISLIPGIGPVNAKKLISYTGSPEAVFKESKENLFRIPDIGKSLPGKITDKSILEKAEKEVEFVIKFKLKAHFYLDQQYPERLRHCHDAPIMLFQKGDNDFNIQKVISIVGTRSATQRGRELCNKFILDLSERHPEVLIVSGLAYGIDIAAHKATLNNDLKTVAVLAHGLSTIYPALHRDIARKIIQQGSLLTEFLSFELPEKPNFVKRNRIIAGLSDATIIVESGKKGGALITADLANSYNRDVFAFPGRVNDTWSKGCNRLILTNRAALIEDVSNFEYLMGWTPQEHKTVQKELFVKLEGEEEKLVSILKEHDHLTLDKIALLACLPVSTVSSTLLGLEFKGMVKSLPGKVYSRHF